MTGKIFGKEIKQYTKDGEVKVSRTLYVVWDKPKNPTDGFEGQKCESVYVPFDLPSCCIVGNRCDFQYEIVQLRSGLSARLTDIIPANS